MFSPFVPKLSLDVRKLQKLFLYVLYASIVDVLQPECKQLLFSFENVTLCSMLRPKPGEIFKVNRTKFVYFPDFIWLMIVLFTRVAQI